MLRISLFVLFAFFAFPSIYLADAQSAPRRAGNSNPSRLKKRKPSKTFYCQLPYSVTGLTLDKHETEACSGSDGLKISVAVTAVAGEDDSRYAYTVSAGKVIGEGANILWDLSGVDPGTYTITTGIEEYSEVYSGWKVFGKTMTASVKISPCQGRRTT